MNSSMEKLKSWSSITKIAPKLLPRPWGKYMFDPVLYFRNPSIVAFIDLARTTNKSWKQEPMEKLLSTHIINTYNPAICSKYTRGSTMS